MPKSTKRAEMNTLQSEIFLELLRANLHNAPPCSTKFVKLNEEDWSIVWQTALNHGVAAQVLNSAFLLPQECLPPEKLSVKFFSYIHHIRMINENQQKVLADVWTNYEKMGLSPVLLKGFDNSACYHEPLLRSPGDIDLLFANDDLYQKANVWMLQQGFENTHSALYEQGFSYCNTIIENHNRVSFFGKPKYDNRLTTEQNKLFERGEWRTLTVGDVSVRCLPATFAAMYLLQHIVHHFSYFGIGYKQVCDWAIFLRTHREQIETDEFERLIRLFDLYHPMEVFGGFCIRYLGFSAEDFPISFRRYPEEELLLKEVIDKEGNFGHSAFKGVRFKNDLHRRWEMFKVTTKRSLKLSKIAPHHIKTVPLVAISNRIRMLFSNLQ